MKTDRDGRIFLDLKNHVYTVDGIADYMSVTTFKDTWFKFPYDSQKAADNCKDEQLSHLDSDEKKIMWNRENEEKKCNGITLHSWIEDFYTPEVAMVGRTNGEFLKVYLDQIKCEGFSMSDLKNTNRAWYLFLKFVKANSDWELLHSEWRIFHDKYKLAGTIDAFYRVRSPEGDKYIICDWKRVKHLKFDNKFKMGNPQDFPGVGVLPATNYWDYTIQLNAYRIILEDCYNVKVDNMMIVRLSEYGRSFEIHLIPREDQPYRAILESRIKNMCM